MPEDDLPRRDASHKAYCGQLRLHPWQERLCHAHSSIEISFLLLVTNGQALARKKPSVVKAHINFLLLCREEENRRLDESDRSSHFTRSER